MCDKENDFIGKRFGENGHLEIVGDSGKRNKSGNIIYTVKCHRCLEDRELFGDGMFESTRAKMTSGSRPCGCAPNYLWSEEQSIVRLQRVSAIKQIKFLGFVGEYVGHSTKLSLQCLIDGYVWHTTSINHFLNVGGCPQCGAKKNVDSKTKPESAIIQSFISTGKFLEGTSFKRLESKRWEYTCPKCSFDEYVQAGLCSGKFESWTVCLQAGQKSCRCSTRYDWTKEQREYQISKILPRDGVSFIDWDREFCGNKSYVVLSCEKHGEWSTAMTNVLYIGTGCPQCADYGFNPGKEGLVYVLDVFGNEGGFTGYGITRNLKDRLQDHKRNLHKKGFVVTEVTTFALDGQTALDIENALKYNFPIVRQDVDGFRKEATYRHLYEQVVDFIHNFLDKGETHDNLQTPLGLYGGGHFQTALPEHCSLL